MLNAKLFVFCLFFVCFCYCCLDFVEIFPNFADFIVVLSGELSYIVWLILANTSFFDSC